MNKVKNVEDWTFIATVTVLVISPLYLIAYTYALLNQLLDLRILLCLTPFALIAAIVVLFEGSVVLTMFGEALSEERVKFLERYGVKTQATIRDSITFHHPDLGICFKGHCEFSDLRGIRHTFAFQGFCYGLMHMPPFEGRLENYYQPGKCISVVYLAVMPSLHHFYAPPIRAKIDSP